MKRKIYKIYIRPDCINQNTSQENVIEARGKFHVYEGILYIESYCIPIASIVYWKEL